ncbi:hypothetical protein ACFLS9_00730 [Bacteroidota bacterium]
MIFLLNKMNKILISIVTILILFSSLDENKAGSKYEISLKIGIFQPADPFFESFYKRGIIYGISGGWIHAKGVGIFLSTDLYFKSIEYNNRVHDVMLIPITFSIVYLPLNQDNITPIIGFGWGWYLLNDKSLFTTRTDTRNSFGYHGFTGMRMHFNDQLFTELQIKYSFSRADRIKGVNIGGWTSMLGIGYTF